MSLKHEPSSEPLRISVKQSVKEEATTQSRRTRSVRSSRSFISRSFRALSGRLKFTVRRHKLMGDSDEEDQDSSHLPRWREVVVFAN